MPEPHQKRIEQYIRNATVQLYVNDSFTGTGFFISNEGYVLTAYHCVGSKPKKIELKTPFDGLVAAQLELHKSLLAYDLAILKTNHEPSHFLPLGQINEEQIGDLVVTIGYPASNLSANREVGTYKGNLSRWRDDDMVELSNAIKGKGHSGASVYHYETKRVIGVVTDRYKENIMGNSGLATRLDKLFAKWLELEDLNEGTIEYWNKLLRSSKHKGEGAVSDLEHIPHEILGESSEAKPSNRAILIPPGGQVPLDSPFYIKRLPWELSCEENILQPGALIRIKAPRKMGKTSLITRMLHQADQPNYRTVYLSFEQADKGEFSNLTQFLRWFCLIIAHNLEFKNKENQLDKLDDYFNSALGGSKMQCKAYFENCILEENSLLVLGLDEIDLLVQYPEIAQDFFSFLRFCHEEGKRKKIWQQLCLVLVYSTEMHIPLDTNQSPFNVGILIDSREFTLKEVKDLSGRYELNLNRDEVQSLMNIVGGYPYLVQLAFYHLASGSITLDKLLETAHTGTGIYKEHLRKHLWNLHKDSALMEVMKQVVLKNQSVRLSAEAFKLESMGLVKFQDDKAITSCTLYSSYFENLFFTKKKQTKKIIQYR